MDINNLDDLLDLNRKVPREDSDIENRKCFIDFLKGLLRIDPSERWTASQAIMHPFVHGRVFEEFLPIKSKIYLEVQKSRPTPAGCLRGSCPSLLQRIRGSQDLTVKPQDVCFRPLVEELKDDFFTGFAHGKLVQVQHPPQPTTQWTNPYINIPISLQPNTQIIRPLPDIVGPRYDRPHSYGAGEDCYQLPRPFSPMIEENTRKPAHKYFGNKKFKRNNKNQRGGSSGYTTKVINIETRPNSLDDKRNLPSSDKKLSFSTIDPSAITQSTIATSKVVDPPSGFLSKIKKEAQQEIFKENR